MAEGRQRASWDQTSSLMALLANINRDPKKRTKPYQPADFSPLRERRKPKPIPAPITVLRDIFVPK